ncbi:glycosyltransferase [Escherichia coli]|nr:glycosyltransferase [Escherichia coli]
MAIKEIEITAIVPTIGRETVFDSLKSIISQTYKVFEIIIVYDGADFVIFEGKINKYFEGIKNREPTKYKVINVGPFSGGNVARQKAIETARTEYVALLDDDDIWLDNHIEDYISLLEKKKNHLPVLLSCAANIILTESKVVKVPTRFISEGETIPEYLFKIRNIIADCGFIQSSLLMFSRQLAIDVPFNTELKFHQDIDWLLRLSQSNIHFDFIQSRNNTVTYNSTPLSVSKKITPSESKYWAIMTFRNRRCMGDFILTQSYNYARNNGSLLDEFVVLISSIRYARPGVFSLIRYFIKLSRIDVLIKKFLKDK